MWNDRLCPNLSTLDFFMENVGNQKQCGPAKNIVLDDKNEFTQLFVLRKDFLEHYRFK